MYIQYSIKSWIENFLRIILYIYIDLIIVTTILFILLYLRYDELPIINFNISINA